VIFIEEITDQAAEIVVEDSAEEIQVDVLLVVGVIAEDQWKCLKLFVTTAVAIVKYLFVHQMTNQFIATIVFLKRIEKVVKHAREEMMMGVVEVEMVVIH